ncbi:MAG: HAD family hydrolase [Prevotella sp.]|nr:HAD family hydrolase [Prevotella sp.]
MCDVICFDLDDTLYKEIEYLKSAYQEIAYIAAGHCRGFKTSVSALAENGYETMLEAYKGGKNAFSTLNDLMGLDLPIGDYLAIYRNHFPNIQLSDEVERMLSELQREGYVLGIITDGRSVQQRHKIKALGLERFFSDDNIIISEEFGSEKPSEANYRYFMERYPCARQFAYIGDDLRKDFITPKRLGWKTICLLDDGSNIHRQDFSCKEEFLPDLKISTLKELFSLQIIYNLNKM